MNDSKKGDEFINALELDDKGEVKNVDQQLEKAKAEFGGKIGSTKVTGTKVDTPPANAGTKMTKEEIINIKDAAERQAAIAANPEAFGLAAKE